MNRMMRFVSILMAAAVFTGGPFLFSQSEPEPEAESRPKAKVTFFSGKSLYFYVMGSYNHFLPPADFFLELGGEGSDAFAPALGIGYRILNIRDRFFVNIECDYSTAEFDFHDFSRNQEISLLTFMLQAEGKFSSRSPITFFGGMGMGFHRLSSLGYYNLTGDYIRVGDENITTIALGMGIKVQISRHFTFRSEFRLNGEVYVDYYNDYYYDWWDDEWSDSDWNFLSSSLSIGLEFHF